MRYNYNAHLYVVSTVLAMVYMKHASHFYRHGGHGCKLAILDVRYICSHSCTSMLLSGLRCHAASLSAYCTQNALHSVLMPVNGLHDSRTP